MDLRRIIEEGESQQVEFKSTFNVEAMESIVAFANTEGGKVVIGVSNKRKIVGVVINEESLQQWVNEIKSKTEPSILVDAMSFEIEGKTIVVLSVAEYPVKPISLHDRFFKRIGNSNHLLSASEIANMSILSAYLLFGKDSIGYNVHIGRFKTPSMIIDDRMMNGNLFEAVEETMRFLISHIKVAYQITGKTTQRTEIFEYPLPALREIVLNTVIHRDYTSPMDVQIKVFDQKITFFSPGELFRKQTIEALRTDNYQAYTRNKLIAEAFYLTGDIEKYGTGYTRNRSEIASYPTMRFDFEEKPSAWLVTISYETRKTDEENDELATNLSQLVTNLSVQVKTLVISLNKHNLSLTELQLVTKDAPKSKPYFKKHYIDPAIEPGIVAMLYPDNPKHPKQKYYLTEKGKEVLKTLES